MSDASPARRRRNRTAIAIWTFGGVVALILVPPFVASFPGLAARAGGHDLHAVNWALFAQQSLVLRIHVVAISLAVILGAVMMASVKGRRFHRIVGWTWAALVLISVLSAVGIGLSNQRWNAIQLTVPFVLALLIAGLLAARRHDVTRHRGLMMWLYYSSILGAGAFTFLPGRLMWRLIFG
jgi:uncharacterized membrane protein